ncbi:hypothetical protein EFA69_03765 [Rufibacter immobilis]|uniref:STAS/SEC14 domain-containing protein n=1 Tax=Rufibacter immobilis TaxID=1348778 RepID=A0A3M9N3R8_9BACT|nr:hypothetical protein [Rufibacter immobilis]RNI32450.1 hypothetical protein EFA69_03765 [Rufibacter immobilis]
MIMTYFQNHVFTLTYDDEHQLGVAQAAGFLNSEEFREAMMACLHLIEERQPLRWIADNRQMKAIRQADQEWYLETIFPVLRDSTIRRNATVMSEDIFNKMAIQQILNRVDHFGEMLLKEFDDKDEALAWVLQPIAQ